MGDRWKEYGLVFCNIYGSFFNPDHVWYLFKKLLKAAGLPSVRFHDLRHSAATVLLAAGGPFKMGSEVFGQRLVSINVDILPHVLPGRPAKAGKRTGIASTD